MRPVGAGIFDPRTLCPGQAVDAKDPEMPTIGIGGQSALLLTLTGWAFLTCVSGLRDHWPARPTLTPQIRFLYSTSAFLRGKTRADPTLPPAVHRFDVGVAHLLKIIRGQRRTESTAAVKNHLRP